MMRQLPPVYVTLVLILLGLLLLTLIILALYYIWQRLR